MAEAADLSIDSIKQIEHGSRAMSLENFMRIVDALEIPLSYLLYEKSNEIPITEQIKMFYMIGVKNRRSIYYICWKKWLRK